jgi:carbon-monoxide dehydrogenase small subunit
MLATGFLRENVDPTEEQIREAMSSNLCRCTGYQGIIEAVQSAAGQRGSPQPLEATPEARRAKEELLEGVSSLRDAGNHGQ